MLTQVVLTTLAETLAEEGARIAYLFGSHARGNPGPLSDIDLAVLFGLPLSPEASLDRTLSVMASVSPLFDARVGVVVLDTAPAELRYAVIGEGNVLLNLDNDLRVSFEARTVSEYLDMEYLRSIQRRHLHRHVQEALHGS